MNAKAAKVSPDRQGKRRIARCRTTIAISWETICAQLDQLDTPTELAALLEIHRRATRRLETICEKINEQAAASDP